MLQRVTASAPSTASTRCYELPAACTAWDDGGCVLERAFEDLGVVVVDYARAYGRDLEFKHGLGGFICDFDAGRYPELLGGR